MNRPYHYSNFFARHFIRRRVSSQPSPHSFTLDGLHFFIHPCSSSFSSLHAFLVLSSILLVVLSNLALFGSHLFSFLQRLQNAVTKDCGKQRRVEEAFRHVTKGDFLSNAARASCGCLT
eukprot:GEMP01054231.1.p1 GENE.GEMP01054231.1~~GEMP01054231.1.p1  ORF type:complete len:119 (-),score=10.90 GEMP01054231.1:599-955(-)